MSKPLAKNQIEAILGQFKRVGVQDRLNESGRPVDLTAVQELVERLTRAADPASGEMISQRDFMQAIDRIRTDVRTQLKIR